MSWKNILKEDGMENLISTMQEAFENYLKKYDYKGYADEEYVKQEMMKAKDTHSRAKLLLDLLNAEDKYFTEDFLMFSDSGRKGLLEQKRSLSAITNMKHRGMTLDEMV